MSILVVPRCGRGGRGVGGGGGGGVEASGGRWRGRRSKRHEMTRSILIQASRKLKISGLGLSRAEGLLVGHHASKAKEPKDMLPHNSSHLALSQA